MPVKMDCELCVTTTIGVTITLSIMFRSCPLRVNEETLPTNLIQMEVQNYDIILGID